MLKHVSHRSSSSLSRSCDFFRSVGSESPERDKSSSSGDTSCSASFRQCPDNVSLTSALSFSSLAVGGRLCSRTSSTVSLSEHATIPVKIYLRRLRSDMEYKTVSLSLKTTCKELVTLLLSKFRLRHRDPNLFFVLMEVTVRSPSDGAPVRRQLVLDDNARPAELQQCRPKGEANFSIGVRRGGLVRVHDSVLMAGSQYKSLMVSYSTTAVEVVKLVLNCYKIKDDAKYYCLHEICKGTELDRRVAPDEFPIQVQASWPKDNKASWAFVLRPITRFSISSKSLSLWRRSIDQSSTDTESDHDTTRASIMSCSSTISHSSTSSGVSSDSCSSEISISDRGSPVLSPTSSRSPSSITLTPESYSKISGRPPKPIPRTLFPSPTAKQSSSSDDDSGVAFDEDFTPLNLSKDDSEAPLRSSSLSTPSVKRTHSRYARIKSLSKSSMDLKSLPFRKDFHTKSSLNLSLSGLFLDKSPLSLALPKKIPTFQATSTPKATSPTGSSGSEKENEEKVPEKKSSLPLKLRLSTSLRKEPSCACKSCFYI